MSRKRKRGGSTAASRTGAYPFGGVGTGWERARSLGSIRSSGEDPVSPEDPPQRGRRILCLQSSGRFRGADRRERCFQGHDGREKPITVARIAETDHLAPVSHQRVLRDRFAGPGTNIVGAGFQGETCHFKPPPNVARVPDCGGCGSACPPQGRVPWRGFPRQ